jgi:hypothetical protein
MFWTFYARRPLTFRLISMAVLVKRESWAGSIFDFLACQPQLGRAKNGAPGRTRTDVYEFTKLAL